MLRDVAAASGVDFRHDSGANGGKHLPETMGSGVAWIDADGDGWEDLYLVQSGPFPPGKGSGRSADRIYRNLGPAPEREARSSSPGAARGFLFEDVTEQWGAGDAGYGQGVLAADFDGDGDLDLFVANYGRDTFWWNELDRDARGDGRGGGARTKGFLAGAVGPDDPRSWSSSAAALDSNGDGRLELYVTRYVNYDPNHSYFCGELGREKSATGVSGGLSQSAVLDYCDPSLFEGQTDLFFRDRSPFGGIAAHSAEQRGEMWEEISEAAGLRPAPGHPAGKGLGVVAFDFNGDGNSDVYVANDITLNELHRGRGDGTFEDVSLFSGTATNGEGRAEAGMGLAVEDFDGNGLPDIAVTNFDVETNTLYRNLGELFFVDVSAATGFAQPSFNLLGFGIVAADFDLDGELDFFIGNGHIFESPKRQNVSYRQPALVLRGTAGGRYAVDECAQRRESLGVARGVASGDFDRDGRVDVAVNHSGGAAALWHNETPESAERTWLAIELAGSAPNSQAIGAWVELDQGAARQSRVVKAGDSYQSSSSRRLVFAVQVGAPWEMVIHWPSGKPLVVQGVGGGRSLRVSEPPA